MSEPELKATIADHQKATKTVVSAQKSLASGKGLPKHRFAREQLMMSNDKMIAKLEKEADQMRKELASKK
jgi:hypothetical protein